MQGQALYDNHSIEHSHPRGFLPLFPCRCICYCLVQTIAGAVATGTHGSNLGPHCSLSHQVGLPELMGNIMATGSRPTNLVTASCLPTIVFSSGALLTDATGCY